MVLRVLPVIGPSIIKAIMATNTSIRASRKDPRLSLWERTASDISPFLPDFSGPEGATHDVGGAAKYKRLI